MDVTAKYSNSNNNNNNNSNRSSTLLLYSTTYTDNHLNDDYYMNKAQCSTLLPQMQQQPAAFNLALATSVGSLNESACCHDSIITGMTMGPPTTRA